jgi:hypothetical protein
MEELNKQFLQISGQLADTDTTLFHLRTELLELYKTDHSSFPSAIVISALEEKLVSYQSFWLIRHDLIASLAKLLPKILSSQDLAAYLISRYQDERTLCCNTITLLESRRLDLYCATKGEITWETRYVEVHLAAAYNYLTHGDYLLHVLKRSVDERLKGA